MALAVGGALESLYAEPGALDIIVQRRQAKFSEPAWSRQSRACDVRSCRQESCVEVRYHWIPRLHRKFPPSDEFIFA